MTLVIGLAGHSLSGKGVIVNGATVDGVVIVRGFTERAKAAHLKLKSLSFSDILLERINERLGKQLRKDEVTTKELQKEARDMDDEDGPGALSRAMGEHIHKKMNGVDIVTVDGVRWPTDRDMIRSFPKNMLAGVVADEEIRHERALAREEKKGESDITFEDFQKQGKVENEVYIDEIVESADYILYNNKELKDFEKVVGYTWSEALKRM